MACSESNSIAAGRTGGKVDEADGAESVKTFNPVNASDGITSDVHMIWNLFGMPYGHRVAH